MSEFTNRIFQKALNHLLETTGSFPSQKKLAITAQVSEGMISNMIHGTRNYGERSHLKVANAFGYRLEDFYRIGIALEEDQPIGEIDPNKKKYPDETTRTAKGKKAPKVKQPSPDYAGRSGEKAATGQNNGGNNLKILHVEHGNLIKAFQDQEAGYEINQALIEIERLDKEEFDRIRDFVRFSLDRVRSKKIAGENSE